MTTHEPNGPLLRLAADHALEALRLTQVSLPDIGQVFGTRDWALSQYHLTRGLALHLLAETDPDRAATWLRERTIDGLHLSNEERPA